MLSIRSMREFCVGLGLEGAQLDGPVVCCARTATQSMTGAHPSDGASAGFDDRMLVWTGVALQKGWGLVNEDGR